MRTTRQISITLPVEMAAMVKNKVAGGAYASESEVIREGLRALAERDEAIERWIQYEVLPVYDEMRLHPERGIPIDEVFDDIHARYRARQTAKS